MRQGLRSMTAVLLAAVLTVAAAFAVPDTARAQESGYHLYINTAKNVVTAYLDGEPVRAMLCSTGVDTPKEGTWNLPAKYRWHELNGKVYGQYCSRITPHMLFHSVPLHSPSPAALKTNYYDKLGTTASAGCTRLNTADAKWIYENCPVGTPITFYVDRESDGPLGRPYFCKISKFPERLRCWDPTDVTLGNPWNEYVGEAFDAAYYQAAYPDLQGAVWNEDSLRFHWLTAGIREGRVAAEGFSVNAYREARPDLQAIYGDDNYAYVRHYNYEKKLEQAGNFNAAHYADRYPDLKAAYGYDEIALLDHYLTYGMAEGRDAS